VSRCKEPSLGIARAHTFSRTSRKTTVFSSTIQAPAEGSTKTLFATLPLGIYAPVFPVSAIFIGLTVKLQDDHSGLLSQNMPTESGNGEGQTGKGRVLDTPGGPARLRATRRSPEVLGLDPCVVHRRGS
jgi:hypothetical protein